MAFQQGIAQTVHIVTLDGATPTAPTNPVVTVSLDNGATFEAPDNEATTTAYGIALTLSATETNRDLVLVRVASDNCDTAIQTFYFEADWTATRAGYLDAAISSIAGGTGAAAITLYVEDGDSNPIAGAAITVPGAGTLSTGALGSATFNLDDATYSVTVRSSSAYTPAASYSVVVSGGAVTSPAGGVLTVTAIALPTPSSPSCYALYDTETDEKDAAFGASGMTVTVTGLSTEGRVDATNNRFRSVMGRSATTDANGQWSMDIPIQAFTAGAWLTLQKSWTDAAGVAQVETWKVLLSVPASGTQVCMSDLSCSRQA